MGRFTRRTFLKALGVGGAALLVPDAALALPGRRYWALDSTMLPPWSPPLALIFSERDGQALVLSRHGRDGAGVLARSQSWTPGHQQCIAAMVVCHAGDVLRSSGVGAQFTVPVAGHYLVSGACGPAGRRFGARWLGAA